MSDSLIYTDAGSFMPETVVARKTSDSKLSLIKVLVAVLCVVLVVEIVIYTIIIPTQVPVKVSFSGLQMYSPEEMKQIINISENQTWIKFNSASAASALSGCSWIESVTVEKRFPDTVHISVVERNPVALTFINIAGRTVPVQIDEEGVLFWTKQGASVGHLPLVTGLPIDNYVDGMRLHSKYRLLMKQLDDIQKLPQKYLAAVSEIHVVPKEYGNYDLVLYPINSQVRVLTDRTLNEDALQYMVVVLDVVNSIEPDIAEIDLRYGSVSFRKVVSGSQLTGENFE